MKKRLISALIVSMILLTTISTGLGSITASASSYGPYRIDIELTTQLDLTNQELINIIDSYSDEFLLNAEGIRIWFANPLTDISYVFERMPNLKLIYVYGCKSLNNIEGIENCTKLEYLAISNCALESIEPIRNLTSLFYLSVSFNKISDISLLRTLPNLTRVDLRVNYISDMSPLMREKPYDWLF